MSEAITKLSVIVPAHNEEQNIGGCLQELCEQVGRQHNIPLEVIAVDDNCSDSTAAIVRHVQLQYPEVRLVQRSPPAGFGRAIRAGLDAIQGDVVVIYMGDLSDDPQDVVKYYRKIQEGFDGVFGSRFMAGSKVANYPRLKLICNRIVNRCIQWLFWTKFNDLTNAFKAYRVEVLRACGPFNACHFNITLEMSLGVLIRKFHVTQIPISWCGRTWGSSKLKLREMGRHYLSTLIMVFFQWMLIRNNRMTGPLSNRDDMPEQ